MLCRRDDSVDECVRFAYNPVGNLVDKPRYTLHDGIFGGLGLIAMTQYFYLNNACLAASTSLQPILVTSCSVQGWTAFRQEDLAIKQIEASDFDLKLRLPVDGMIQEFAYVDEVLERQRQLEKSNAAFAALLAACFNSTVMVIPRDALATQSLPAIASDTGEAIVYARQEVTVKMLVTHPACLPDWQLFESEELSAIERARFGFGSKAEILLKNDFAEFRRRCVERCFESGDVLPFTSAAEPREGFLRIVEKTELENVYLGDLLLIGITSPVSSGTVFFKRSVGRLAGNLFTINSAIFEVQ